MKRNLKCKVAKSQISNGYDKFKWLDIHGRQNMFFDQRTKISKYLNCIMPLYIFALKLLSRYVNFSNGAASKRVDEPVDLYYVKESAQEVIPHIGKLRLNHICSLSAMGNRK